MWDVTSGMAVAPPGGGHATEESCDMPVARSSFSVGGGRIVRFGDVVAADDPVVSGREHLFDGVEQATAAPGERRDVVPPSAKVACDVDGCGYEGSRHGLSIHTGRSH